MSDFINKHHGKVIEETIFWMEHEPVSAAERYRHSEYSYLILHYKDAVTELEAVAEESIMAKYSLGYCYYYGIGTMENRNKAQKLFQEFMEKMKEKAFAEEEKYRVAMCYGYGLGISADGKEALELFTSLENTHGGAAYEKAVAYQEGKWEIGKSKEKAGVFYLKAHELLYEGAILSLYEMDGRKGKEFPYYEEVKSAYSYLIGRYTLAARNQPCADAYMRLAKIYEEGFPGDDREGLDRFLEKAKKYYEKARGFAQEELP